jgi:hypothetical protein
VNPIFPYLTILLAVAGAVALTDDARAANTSSVDLDAEEIIARFARKESEFREVWQQYTYTQRVLFQVLSRRGEPREQREMVFEVYFTNDGRRQTRVVSDRGGLRSVGVTQEDIDDAVSLQPFVLTTDEVDQYRIRYRGRERVDELDTYVFDVRPHRIERGERYFRGRIWVDDRDFQIVMTRGKIEPDYRDNKFPEFETLREQIDGDYWFPTWTEADDVLHFGDPLRGYHNVRVRMLITYGNFQKYEVGTTIQFGEPVEEAPQP